MYVIVNNFDYVDLLNKLVPKLSLEDVPLTDDVVKKTFLDLERRFNINQRNELSNDELALVEYYFTHFIGISFTDFVETDEEKAATGADHNDFLYALSTEYEESLIALYTIMMDEENRDKYSKESGIFVDKLMSMVDIKEGEEPFEAALEYLETLVDKYVSRDVNEIDLLLLKEMECALAEGERLSNVHVLNKPGKIVKYGNTLITFPIIVIEASHTWQI